MHLPGGLDDGLDAVGGRQVLTHVNGVNAVPRQVPPADLFQYFHWTYEIHCYTLHWWEAPCFSSCTFQVQQTNHSTTGITLPLASRGSFDITRTEVGTCRKHVIDAIEQAVVQTPSRPGQLARSKPSKAHTGWAPLTM